MTDPTEITVITVDPEPVVTGIGLLDPPQDPVPVAIAAAGPPDPAEATVVSLSGFPVVIVSPGSGSGGDGGGPAAFHHEQITALSTWTIPHGLGFNPAGIVARDATGLIEPANITYPDPNTCVLAWAVPVAGSADLS